jgi:hypothetical protein
MNVGEAEVDAVKTAVGSHSRAGWDKLTIRIAVGHVRKSPKRSHAFVVLSDFDDQPVGWRVELS